MVCLARSMLRFVIALSVLTVAVGAVSYLDVLHNSTIKCEGRVIFTGQEMNGSNYGQGLPGYNITAGIRNSTGALLSMNYSNSTTNGSFTVNVSLPSTPGFYNISIFDNSTDTGAHAKSGLVFFTNASNASFAFTNARPPFSNGTSFGLNVTLYHCNGSALVGYNPVFVIYSTAGRVQNWTVTNSSALTNIAGTKTYSIAVPADATGQYAVVVENGAGFQGFEVKSVIRVAATTETNSSFETRSDFTPNSTVRLMAKLRDVNGTPISSATVNATVSYPNGSSFTVGLTEYDSANNPGYYAVNYTLPEVIGGYNAKITASSGGANETTTAQFNLRKYSATLSGSKREEGGFFMEWGGSRGIAPGAQIGFNLLVTNLSTTTLVAGALNYIVGGAVNCSNLSNVALYFPNDTFMQFATTTFGNGSESGTSVCKLVFSSPSTAGSFIAKLNVTLESVNVTALGSFTTQNYFVKGRPVSSLGGGDFMQVFMPGDNVTLSFSIFNVSNGTAISNGSNITGLWVRRVSSMDFKTGGSDLNFSSWTTCNSAACTSRGFSPQTIVTLPTSTTGMIIIDFIATVNPFGTGGENVTGNAFILSKYIEGFITPGGIGDKGMGGGEGEMGGGPGGQGGGGAPQSSCSGIEVFKGFARDLKTNQNAQGVIVNGIKDARDEMTGKSIVGCLGVNSSISNSSSTGNNIEFNVSFASNASCQFSGFYFVLFNVTYQGHEDELPSGFRCASLSFWPQVSTGQQNNWQIGVTDSFNITTSNARDRNNLLLSTNHSYNATLVMLEAFSPTTGRMVYRPQIQLRSRINESGQVNLTVNLSVFGLSRWPSGFMNLQVLVSNGTTSGTGGAGIQAVAFNAFINFMGGMPTVSVGDVYNATIYVQSNVSSNRTAGVGEIQGDNTTGFKVQVGRPEFGQFEDAPLLAVRNVTDGWNKSTDFGFEVWVVNFTVPANTPKGFSPAMITVNNSRGETVETMMPLLVSKYSVAVPDAEYLEFYRDKMQFFPNPVDNNTAVYWNDQGELNFSDIWTVHGKKSQGGFICAKNQFNTTQFAMMGQRTAVYNDSVRVGVLDTVTAGVFDTVVINQTLGNASGGLVTIHNISNRTIVLKNATLGGAVSLKLWEIKDCGFVSLINTSTSVSGGFSNNWGGQHVSGEWFVLPFKVTRAGRGVASATIGINNIVEQNDMGGSRGGMGFKSILREGQNYTVNAQGSTDAAGIAFVNMTINGSGQFNMFWNASIGSDSDTASFENGIFTEVKRFRSEGMPVAGPVATVRLRWAVNGTQACGNNGVAPWCTNITGYYPGGGNLSISNANTTTNESKYIGVWSESSDGVLVDDNVSMVWYVTYAPATFGISLTNASNFVASNAVTRTGIVNFSINVGSGVTPLSVGYVNETVNNTLYLQLYGFSNQGGGGGNGFSPSSATSNITARVCTYNFGAQQTPVIGANVSFFTQQFTRTGPVSSNLTAFSVLNNAETTAPQPTGLVGCIAAVLKAPSGGWPDMRSGGVEVKVRAYNNTGVEQGWVGMVQLRN